MWLCVCIPCPPVRVLTWVLTAMCVSVQGVGDDQSEKEKKQAEQRQWLQELRKLPSVCPSVCV